MKRAARHLGSQLRAEDGREVDLYHASRAGDGLSCVTATHFAPGAMNGPLARLAAAQQLRTPRPDTAGSNDGSGRSRKAPEPQAADVGRVTRFPVPSSVIA